MLVAVFTAARSRRRLWSGPETGSVSQLLRRGLEGLRSQSRGSRCTVSRAMAHPEEDIERLKQEVSVPRLVEAQGTELNRHGSTCWECASCRPARRIWPRRTVVLRGACFGVQTYTLRKIAECICQVSTRLENESLAGTPVTIKSRKTTCHRLPIGRST
ncbi:MAG: hypothetical protein U0Q18_25955 [Bryobacteraceae bacterium]